MADDDWLTSDLPERIEVMTTRPMMSLAFLAAVLPAFALACDFGSSSYKSAAVEVGSASVDATGTLALAYDTPGENLYASPGVVFRRSGPSLHVEVVRCWIHRQCKVDAASTITDMRYLVKIPAMGDICRLYLDDSQASREVKLVNHQCPTDPTHSSSLAR